MQSLLALSAAINVFTSCVFVLTKPWNHFSKIINSHSLTGSPHLLQSPSNCNPYELRGTLRLNSTSWHQNSWIPFDETCQPINWMLAIKNYSEIGSTLNSPVSDVNLHSNLDWLKNKTICLMGDSLDRYQVEDFCLALNATFNRITIDHPSTPTIPQHLWDADLTAENHDYSALVSRPTMCHVPSLNFSLISAFHWSLSDATQLREAGIFNNYHYYPPTLTSDRLDYIVLPLLRNLGRDIDLFQFSSYVWDTYVSLWAESKRLSINPEPVNMIDVDLYESRLRQVLPEIALRLLPTVPMLWRTPHLLPNLPGSIGTKMGWALKAKSQTVIEELTGRTWSLSQSTRHALRTKTTANKSAPLYGRLRVGGLGDLVPGYEHWYRDQIHLGYAQNIVGGNYLLHQLYLSTKNSTV